MCTMPLILSGLASIPFTDTRQLRTLPFLKNNADAPLPVFTASRPIPQPNRGYDVAQTDLCRLQTLREVISRLL
jgi:hypothetical protein